MDEEAEGAEDTGGSAGEAPNGRTGELDGRALGSGGGACAGRGRSVIRLGGIMGLPVVRQGRILGRVEQAVLDESGKFLRGMVVRKGIGGAMWLGNPEISVIGGVSILAKGELQHLPGRVDFELTSVKDASGLRLGRVTDVLLNPMTRRVAALEISLGPLEEWRHGRALLREFTVRPTPEEPGQVLVPCGFILEPFPGGR